MKGAHNQIWPVPAASYFVAGDNPSVSDDSRVWDEPFVPIENVEAVVIRRLAWPRLARVSGFVDQLLQLIGLGDRH